ncbi:DinB family protein [Moheibacter sediminis]|nr:DinB family protein [Moheibacter sediminis]
MKSTKPIQKSAFQTLIEDQIHYQLWANQSMIDSLKAHPAQKLTAKIPSSYETIYDTVKHIYQVQDFWFKMIQGKSYDFTEKEYSTDELFEKLIQNSNELNDFVCQLDEFELQEKMEIITPWFTSHQPRYELIQQIVTHTAYHRGQIVTMGRNLDITNAANTDFNFYLLMAKPKSEI